MARIGDGGDLLKCSFCGKSQKQVKKLIAGPGVYICDECIDLCTEIIEEELSEGSEVGLEETIAKHSGRSADQVKLDIERDKILSADQAKEYGLIDEVLASRKASLES